LLANNLFSQETYVSFNAGYGFKLSSQNAEFPNTKFGINSTTTDLVLLSYGKGINAGCAFGHMFGKNIGVDFGISYLLGGKTKSKDEYIGGTTDYTVSAKMIRFNPSLVLTSNLDKINFYTKFGFIIGSGSVTREINDNDNGEVTYVKVKLNGGLAYGLNAGVGSLFKLNDKMSFFGELNMISMTYAPMNGKAMEATYNGKDELRDMTTSQKEFEYVDSYTYNSNNTPPDSKPTQFLKQKLPFGSLGINFGLRINL